MAGRNITLKELLSIAKEQLGDITTLPKPDFRLEQAVYKKDSDTWEVVVSYLVEYPNKKLITMAPLLPEFSRIYKRLTINKDKEVEGFYIFDNRE